LSGVSGLCTVDNVDNVTAKSYHAVAVINQHAQHNKPLYKLSGSVRTSPVGDVAGVSAATMNRCTSIRELRVSGEKVGLHIAKVRVASSSLVSRSTPPKGVEI
jgi:hypothetical protein